MSPDWYFLRTPSETKEGATRNLCSITDTGFASVDSLHKLQHKLLGNYSSPCIDGDLHTTDLFVDVFHELDDEVNQLVLPQFLQVGVSHKEADIVSLRTTEVVEGRQFAKLIKIRTQKMYK